ncbi:DUF4845 domain-containing protein [Stenotrophomonas sp. MYb238]|jgi:cytochrome c-type biogenesis protein CcmE|uniref:DUF4845 domain-containing protein n=1 Tax=Stenotrophomonas TaxID=40323 RepID=UPI00129165FD|nr:DUF4845 domain-containing protein [Stenotrophomonas sp. MYb238]MQP77178.1 DUF4845 domain-containing protein [Stenotrophomonas sp. MYb238]
MNRKQGGMTLTSFLMVLAVAGFAVYIGMKLFPMYQEFYAVKTSMKALAKEPGSADPVKAQELFFKRMDMNYSDSVKRENIKFDRIDGGVRMNVSYEVRRPLVGNLDIVGRFENSQELTSHGE